MAFLRSLFTWASAPYTVAFGIAAVFALLQMSGLLGLLAGDHGDADGDADADADHDGGHDVDGDADADADGDADGDHDGDHDGDADEPGMVHGILASLGVGRVPLSIVWQTFAVSFAFMGIAINTVLAGRTGRLPATLLALTVPCAIAFGYAATRVTSKLLGRVLSNPAEEATSRRQLVGRTGVVISTRVDGAFGEVRIQDRSGHVVRVMCKAREEERPIPEGREIVVVDYDRERDQLYVAPLEPDAESGPSGAEPPRGGRAA